MAEIFEVRQASEVAYGEGLSTKARLSKAGDLIALPSLEHLGRAGRIFIASDADQNDTVTGQTSFANTTPTFLLNVPSGTTAMPLYVCLVQAGTVAGAAIDVIFEIDNANRYSSGGTAETVLASRTDAPVTNASTLYSGATATAAYGVAFDHILAIPADVAPAITEIYEYHQIKWRPPVPIYVVGPGAFLVYTYAGTTGPTWNWAVAWAEIPTTSI